MSGAGLSVVMSVCCICVLCCVVVLSLCTCILISVVLVCVGVELLYDVTDKAGVECVDSGRLRRCWRFRLYRVPSSVLTAYDLLLILWFTRACRHSTPGVMNCILTTSPMSNGSNFFLSRNRSVIFPRFSCITPLSSLLGCASRNLCTLVRSDEYSLCRLHRRFCRTIRLAISWTDCLMPKILLSCECIDFSRCELCRVVSYHHVGDSMSGRIMF